VGAQRAAVGYDATATAGPSVVSLDGAPNAAVSESESA
jgi:hypothetical protein